jgi:proteasome lid subunit RPN8/RPN11
LPTLICVREKNNRGNWEMEIKVQKVYISWNAYERICIYGERFASKKIPENKQREAYGVLIGHIDPANKEVFVVDAVPVVAGTRTGVEYDDEQYVDTAKIDEDLYTQNLYDSNGFPLFFVGWFHTHPGFGFFYSDVDKITHLGYQSVNQMAIGIVYDYTQRNPYLTDPGIRVFMLTEDDLGEISINSKEIEVPFDIEDFTKNALNLDRTIAAKLTDLHNKEKILKFIDEKLNGKEFDELQKIYGLLLIKKDKGDEQYRKERSEKQFLYTWNEENLKSEYKIPSFRKHLETIYQYALDKPGKRKEARTKMEELLSKAMKGITNVKNDLAKAKEELRSVMPLFDSAKRLIITQFEEKINTYIEILNNMKNKAFNLAPDTGWEPVEVVDMIELEKNMIVENPVSLEELKRKFIAQRKASLATKIENKKPSEMPELTPLEFLKEQKQEMDNNKDFKISEDELFEEEIFEIKEDELFLDE